MTRATEAEKTGAHPAKGREMNTTDEQRADLRKLADAANCSASMVVRVSALTTARDEFAAAANPSAVLALLDEIEAANDALTIAYMQGAASRDEQVRALEKERDEARRDLAIANRGGLDLLYAIRDAIGWNDKTSLEILPRGVMDMREALKPFAKLGDVFNTTWRNTPGNYKMEFGPFNAGPVELAISCGELRAARAALNTEESNG